MSHRVYQVVPGGANPDQMAEAHREDVTGTPHNVTQTQFLSWLEGAGLTQEGIIRLQEEVGGLRAIAIDQAGKAVQSAAVIRDQAVVIEELEQSYRYIIQTQDTILGRLATMVHGVFNAKATPPPPPALGDGTEPADLPPFERTEEEKRGDELLGRRVPRPGEIVPSPGEHRQ